MRELEHTLESLGYRYQILKEGERVQSIVIPVEVNDLEFPIQCFRLDEPPTYLFMVGTIAWPNSEQQALGDFLWRLLAGGFGLYTYGKISMRRESQESLMFVDAAIPAEGLNPENVKFLIQNLSAEIATFAAQFESMVPEGKRSAYRPNFEHVHAKAQ